MNAICKKAVDTYGKELQINQSIEEMGELIASINHFRRGIVSKSEVLSEIADVFIMCEQLAYIIEGTEEGVDMCKDIIVQKLLRLEKRINEHVNSAF